MADYAVWGEAVARGQRWKAGTFIATYNENRKEATEETLQESPLAEILLKTARLNPICPRHPPKSTRGSRAWPASGSLRRPPGPGRPPSSPTNYAASHHNSGCMDCVSRSSTDTTGDSSPGAGNPLRISRSICGAVLRIGLDGNPGVARRSVTFGRSVPEVSGRPPRSVRDRAGRHARTGFGEPDAEVPIIVAITARPAAKRNARHFIEGDYIPQANQANSAPSDHVVEKIRNCRLPARYQDAVRADFLVDVALAEPLRSSHALLTFQRLRKFFIAITHSVVNMSRLSDGIVPAQ